MINYKQHFMFNIILLLSATANMAYGLMKSPQVATGTDTALTFYNAIEQMQNGEFLIAGSTQDPSMCADASKTKQIVLFHKVGVSGFDFWGKCLSDSSMKQPLYIPAIKVLDSTKPSIVILIMEQKAPIRIVIYEFDPIQGWYGPYKIRSYQDQSTALINSIDIDFLKRGSNSLLSFDKEDRFILTALINGKLTNYFVQETYVNSKYQLNAQAQTIGKALATSATATQKYFHGFSANTFDSNFNFYQSSYFQSAKSTTMKLVFSKIYAIDQSIQWSLEAVQSAQLLIPHTITLNSNNIWSCGSSNQLIPSTQGFISRMLETNGVPGVNYPDLVAGTFNSDMQIICSSIVVDATNPNLAYTSYTQHSNDVTVIDTTMIYKWVIDTANTLEPIKVSFFNVNSLYVTSDWLSLSMIGQKFIDTQTIDGIPKQVLLLVGKNKKVTDFTGFGVFYQIEYTEGPIKFDCIDSTLTYQAGMVITQVPNIFNPDILTSKVDYMNELTASIGNFKSSTAITDSDFSSYFSSMGCCNIHGPEISDQYYNFITKEGTTSLTLPDISTANTCQLISTTYITVSDFSSVKDNISISGSTVSWPNFFQEGDFYTIIDITSTNGIPASSGFTLHVTNECYNAQIIEFNGLAYDLFFEFDPILLTTKVFNLPQSVTDVGGCLIEYQLLNSTLGVNLDSNIIAFDANTLALSFAYSSYPYLSKYHLELQGRVKYGPTSVDYKTLNLITVHVGQTPLPLRFVKQRLDPTLFYTIGDPQFSYAYTPQIQILDLSGTTSNTCKNLNVKLSYQSQSMSSFQEVFGTETQWIRAIYKDQGTPQASVDIIFEEPVDRTIISESTISLQMIASSQCQDVDPEIIQTNLELIDPCQFTNLTLLARIGVPSFDIVISRIGKEFRHNVDNLYSNVSTAICGEWTYGIELNDQYTNEDVNELYLSQGIVKIEGSDIVVKQTEDSIIKNELVRTFIYFGQTTTIQDFDKRVKVPFSIEFNRNCYVYQLDYALNFEDIDNKILKTVTYTIGAPKVYFLFTPIIQKMSCNLPITYSYECLTSVNPILIRSFLTLESQGAQMILTLFSTKKQLLFTPSIELKVTATVKNDDSSLTTTTFHVIIQVKNLNLGPPYFKELPLPDVTIKQGESSALRFPSILDPDKLDSCTGSNIQVDFGNAVSFITGVFPKYVLSPSIKTQSQTYPISIKLTDDNFEPSSSIYAFLITVNPKDEIVSTNKTNFDKEVEVAMKIQGINQLGSMKITFSEDISNKVLKMLSNSTTELTIPTRNNEAVSLKEMLVQNSRQMICKLDFVNADSVSINQDLDVLQLDLKEKLMIQEDKTLYYVTPTVLDYGIPSQISEGLLSIFGDFDANEGLTVQTILPRNILANLFVSGMLGYFWGELSEISSLAVLSLISINAPGPARLLSRFILSFAQLDILPSSLMLTSAFQFDIMNDQALSPHFAAIGFDSMNSIKLMGSAFIFLLGAACVFGVQCIIMGLSKKFTRIQGLRARVEKKLKWNAYINLFFQQYITFWISCLISIHRLNPTPKFDGEIIGTLITVIGISACAILPYFFGYYILKNFKTLESEEFISKFGSLTEGMNTGNKISALWNVIGLIRTQLTIFILVQVREIPAIQVGLLLSLSIAFQSVLIRVKPYISRQETLLQFFYEILTSTYLYLYITLTDFVENDRIRTKIAWAQLAVILFQVTLNISNILIRLVRSAIRIYRSKMKNRTSQYLVTKKVPTTNNEISLFELKQRMQNFNEQQQIYNNFFQDNSSISSPTKLLTTSAGSTSFNQDNCNILLNVSQNQLLEVQQRVTSPDNSSIQEPNQQVHRSSVRPQSSHSQHQQKEVSMNSEFSLKHSQVLKSLERKQQNDSESISNFEREVDDMLKSQINDRDKEIYLEQQQKDDIEEEEEIMKEIQEQMDQQK